MPRSTKISESPAPEFDEDLYEATPGPSNSRLPQNSSMSPSPALSLSSDKENNSHSNRQSGDKTMGPPRVPSPGGKRKRAGTTNNHSERVRRRRTTEGDEDEEPEDDFYDPDQDLRERREIRKGLRDLSKTLSENRSEYLDPESDGLKNILLESDSIAGRLKQTSDATIDARLLSAAADLTLKRTVQLVSGDVAQGIDVDDFVGKCKAYMLSSEGAAEDDEVAPSMTQRRRRRNGAEEDNGDQLNWAHLGRFACLKYNSRPSVPGFLLGPLSLQKKAKRVIERKAAFKHSQIQETRPDVLNAADIETSENTSLTTLCQQILTRLDKVTKDIVHKVDTQTTGDETEAECQKIMDRYGISNDGGLALFRFVINPYSFGQTVENTFYVSFLIRDGKLGIFDDHRGLPYLQVTSPQSGKDSGKSGGEEPKKHQAVLSLDWAMWKEMIKLWNIREPMIRHREEEDPANQGQRGWYH